ncbi:MAG: hypothetical protein AAFZ07_15085 [Actinomycetota bacterium]
MAAEEIMSQSDIDALIARMQAGGDAAPAGDDDGASDGDAAGSEGD